MNNVYLIFTCILISVPTFALTLDGTKAGTEISFNEEEKRFTVEIRSAGTALGKFSIQNKNENEFAEAVHRSQTSISILNNYLKFGGTVDLAANPKTGDFDKSIDTIINKGDKESLKRFARSMLDSYKDLQNSAAVALRKLKDELRAEKIKCAKVQIPANSPENSTQ